MICELGTVLHCSMYGSYHQDIIIHQRDVSFDVDIHGSTLEQCFKKVYGSIPKQQGRMGCIITYCDMQTEEWEKYVWVNNTYIVGTKEYNE